MAFKGLTLNTPPEMAAHILAEDDAAIYEALLGDDRVLDIGNKLAATVITNNSVRISDGVAVVGGHVGRIKKGDYQDMTIENGVSGKKRNDLICARFITNGDTDTYNLVVVKGAAGTTATDPSVVKGNLYAGDKQRDFPLWRVCLDGLSITKVQQMFSVSKTNKYFSDQLDQLNRNCNPSPRKVNQTGSFNTLVISISGKTACLDAVVTIASNLTASSTELIQINDTSIHPYNGNALVLYEKASHLFYQAYIAPSGMISVLSPLPAGNYMLSGMWIIK